MHFLFWKKWKGVRQLSDCLFVFYMTDCRSEKCFRGDLWLVSFDSS